jgi:hypothetical protein
MCNIRDYPENWNLTLTENQRGLPSKATVAELLAITTPDHIEEESTNYMGSGPTAEIKVNLNTDDPQAIKPHLNNLMNVSSFSYLTTPIANGVILSYPSLLLACSYALGMLVRYYPTYWNSILQHEKGDHLWPLMRAASQESMSFSNRIAEYF